MSKNLVIVESPAKAKTIGKWIGADYEVLSSQGHIRDIEGVGKNSIGIDFNKNYAPNYAIDPKKHKIIESLKSAAEKADMVWLASDEDREGEAIAWHLKEVLGLSSENTKRIVFHEITKTAIQNALQSPRDIDYNLVNAQQARRVMDRIVGYELSPILWKKVSPGLSAGRVQSVAVRLIVEQEREIENFIPTALYRVVADFAGSDDKGNDVVLRAELNHRFQTKEEATSFLNACIGSNFKITNIQCTPGKKSPAAPFTTSTLQQEAARKLHFTVSKTMRLAQSLYEAGKITYMRTDSFNLSSLALGVAKKVIEEKYGAEYSKTRNYHTSAKGAQEAHEAIRPTYIDVELAGENADEKKLYDLIRKRTIACQMADAEVENTRIEVSMSGSDYMFVASGETITFDGFMRVYIQSNDDETEENENKLPKMSVGTSLSVSQVIASESYNKAPYRYSEASLIKKMEALGIGRPATYLPTIETIQARKYVEKSSVEGKKRDINILTLKGNKISDRQKQEVYGAEPSKFVPTDLGMMTTDFLVEHFPSILSYDFTAECEKDFDEIAKGDENWVDSVDRFYHTFHPLISEVPSGRIPGRILGKDPQTGDDVIAKVTKNGPCIQIGNANDAKPRFASLPRGVSLYTITLDEALKLFDRSYPYVLATIDGADVLIAMGKFGPFVRHKTDIVSIPKSIDPMTITVEEAMQLIDKKRSFGIPLLSFGDIQVLNGTYGPYIKSEGKNYKIPKGQDATSLTEEDCKNIIAKAANDGEKKPSFRRKSKK